MPTDRQREVRPKLARRAFLGQVGGIATATVAAAGLGVDRLLALPASAPSAERADPGIPNPATGSRAVRRDRAARVRHRAEITNWQIPIPPQPDNGDEARYPDRSGNYSKGLLHNDAGVVDPHAYESLLTALKLERPQHFEAIVLGCPAAEAIKLTNPQAGLAFDLEGADSHQFAIPPAPQLASAEAAGEMTELYWMALLRDIDFLDYDSHPLAAEAAAELSALTDFRGPRDGRQVTSDTLFRDALPGTLVGPYVSQFLWRHTPFGAEHVDRKMRTLSPRNDHVTGYGEWLALQQGCRPSGTAQFDPVRRYIRTGRDLAQWVHVDVLFQACFNAMLILMTPPDPSDPVTGGGIGCPLDPGNPYHGSRTQIGFGTFGAPYAATLQCEVATRALKAVWYQKWFVHRRLRPEAYGGRVHNHLTGVTAHPLHPDVLDAAALARLHRAHGSYLLPQVFPEGSPTHPSYGAGHATVAGACVTVLKALFDETHEIPDPVVPTPDGLGLVAYSGPRLTVGGELNKLAFNIAAGRNIAGVNWRSDTAQSLLLGEAVAISILRDQRGTYSERFDGFTFTRFDGQTITA